MHLAFVTELLRRGPFLTSCLVHDVVIPSGSQETRNGQVLAVYSNGRNETVIMPTEISKAGIRTGTCVNIGLVPRWYSHFPRNVLENASHAVDKKTKIMTIIRQSRVETKKYENFMKLLLNSILMPNAELPIYGAKFIANGKKH